MDAEGLRAAIAHPICTVYDSYERFFERSGDQPLLSLGRLLEDSFSNCA